MNISDVLIKPIVSEKSFAEAKANKYTFKVARSATKVDIKNAIEKIYSVNVVSVFTANIKGSKTRNTRFSRRIIDTSYKKARIGLKAGQKISIFEEKTEDKGKGKKKEQKGEKSS